MNTEFRRELNAALEAANAAGDILRTEFNRAEGPRGAHGHAEADELAENVIRQRLAKSFPEDGILGEELGALNPDSAQRPRRLWLVDPNDGTSAYLNGFRGAAVSIALLIDGRPVLGVVFAYNHPDDNGDLIAWTEGSPVTCNGRPVSRTWPEAVSAGSTVLLSHHADHNSSANARCSAPMRYRAMPSIAYRLALVAANEGDAAVSLNAPVSWDLAGGHAILLGAGGDLYDSSGKPIRYSPDGRCCSSSKVFGGPPALVEHLRTQPWKMVFERHSKTLEFSLVWPKPSGKRPDAGMLSRAHGCLLGQIAGDALGSLVEFQGPEQILKKHPVGVRDLVDGGTFNTIAGQPTDDSEMALMLARTIVSEKAFNPESVRRAYQFWLNSDPFDCGTTTSSGLRGRPNPDSQANGALMRVSPLGIFAANHPLTLASEWGRQDSAITHPNPVCQDASALFVMAVAKAVRIGEKPRELYNQIVGWARDLPADTSVIQAIHAAAEGPPDDYLRHQGWVLTAFQNALFQLLHVESLEAGVIDTILHGGDTDTNAAICGALLGAVYGREAVPSRWANRVLTCRPVEGLAGVKRPRPDGFWPVDALILAEQLITSGIE